MKTSAGFFFLCSLLLSSEASAQITITTADIQNMFAIGKVQTSVNADDISKVYMMNVGSASSSQQSWTLPAEQYQDTLPITNVAPSSTPYANEFPSATHAQAASVVTNEGQVELYIYVRIANDSLIFLGSVFRINDGTLDTTMFEFHQKFGVKTPV